MNSKLKSFWTRKIQAHIDINVEPVVVWRVLTELDRYPDWNPFIRKASGDLSVGRKVSVRLDVPGGMRMRLRTKLLVVEPQIELRWIGHAIIPGLFDGEHAFIIQKMEPAQTRFLQTEKFSGLLVPLLGWYIVPGALHGFEVMNQALKRRVENRIQASVK